MNAKNIRYNNRWKTEAIKSRILLHLSTIYYIIDVSNKLNKNLCNIPRVDGDFNFSALDKFRYGDKFIHIVKVVYTKIQSKIKINGLLSDPFTLTREVCQGCLFFMLLYIISDEVRASFINVNNRIKGIQIGDH